MDIANLINHPENLNKETLYDLRSMLALYPYYQPARILLLQNLFLLHDPTFDDELRRAAVYISDRHILFKLVEEAHYQLIPQQKKAAKQSANIKTETAAGQEQDRTTSLIDTFLEQIPEDGEATQETEGRRKPTPADATVDYVAYLLESESKQNEDVTPQLRGQELIDDFPEGIDYLISGIGSGGHISGVGRELKKVFPSILVIGVEPEDSPVISGGHSGAHAIQGIGAGFIPETLDLTVLDSIFHITREDAFNYARRLVKEEGILGGISTGASLAAVAQKTTELRRTKRIVTFNYDTGERYLSVEGLY